MLVSGRVCHSLFFCNFVRFCWAGGEGHLLAQAGVDMDAIPSPLSRSLQCLVWSPKGYFTRNLTQRYPKNMCQGLNSHYFHIIRDGHQPNSRGLYIYIYNHYKDSY